MSQQPMQYVPPQPPVYQVRQQNPGHGLAVASFVLSLFGWVPTGIPAILAVIFAAVSYRQSRNAGQPKEGLATAGLVIGIIALAIGLFWFIVLMIAISTASTVPAGG